MALQKRNIKEEYIVDDINIEPTDGSEAYLIPVTIDKHVRVVTDQDNNKSTQIDPTVPEHVKQITQADINNWNANINSDKNFVHIQSVPSVVWDFIHNLNKKVSVTVVDSSGRSVLSKVEYVNNNRIIITHAGAFSGSAYCN